MTLRPKCSNFPKSAITVVAAEPSGSPRDAQRKEVRMLRYLHRARVRPPRLRHVLYANGLAAMFTLAVLFSPAMTPPASAQYYWSSGCSIFTCRVSPYYNYTDQTTYRYAAGTAPAIYYYQGNPTYYYQTSSSYPYSYNPYSSLGSYPYSYNPYSSYGSNPSSYYNYLGSYYGSYLGSYYGSLYGGGAGYSPYSYGYSPYGYGYSPYSSYGGYSPYSYSGGYPYSYYPYSNSSISVWPYWY
jgi:hypothetical protein